MIKGAVFTLGILATLGGFAGIAMIVGACFIRP